ncbi:MAG TPA: carboxypeptidase-like regulatory domain-containing protein [Chitinophagaceae bacterium]|jgi:hypothetical protein
MKKILIYFGIAFFIIPTSAKAQFENARDSVVELYGIVMTSDSLIGIPAVTVCVKGQNRCTITNDQGVFSIVALKGDVIDFTHVTYKPKEITVPRNLEGTQYSIVQLMVEDTVYLSSTIIRVRPTPEQFARDFVNAKVNDDNIEVARKNNDAAKRRMLLRSVPGDANEATQLQFRNIANKASYAGQTPPMNLFNPAAWADFIQAWKRGDFKNKD